MGRRQERPASLDHILVVPSQKGEAAAAAILRGTSKHGANFDPPTTCSRPDDCPGQHLGHMLDIPALMPGPYQLSSPPLNSLSLFQVPYRV